jgi:hypothetical protein
MVVETMLSVQHLSRGELGDSLGTFRDGVLGELTGEDEADSGLDLAGGEGGLLVDARELHTLRRS